MEAIGLFERADALELTPGSRIHRLREMCWRGIHLAAQHTRRVIGCGEDTLLGHARDFAALLEAVAISYDAACGYAKKHARCAAEMAARESDPRRRAELARIAAVCDELAVGPPSSFHAALQLVQFMRILGASGCMGRFDQWMAPFDERDVSAGTLTRQEAQELVECFIIKLNHFGTAGVSPFYIAPWCWGWCEDDGDRQVLAAVGAVDGDAPGQYDRQGDAFEGPRQPRFTPIPDAHRAGVGLFGRVCRVVSGAPGPRPVADGTLSGPVEPSIPTTIG